MNEAIQSYHDKQTPTDRSICERLAVVIDRQLPEAESKIWHGHPVWFLNSNPVVGYSKLKAGIRLLFWSGASFEEETLQPGSGKFKDASKLYTHKDEINEADVIRWLEKSRNIQWDYKNLVKRKGRLERLV